MAVINQEQAAQLAKIRQQNSIIYQTTEWQWAQFANGLAGGGGYVPYAVGANFRFVLQNTSGFMDYIRIWFQGITIANSSTTAAGTLNRNGFYQLIQSFQVALGNNIYRVPTAAIPLLWQTYSARGDLANYRGNQSYGYSSSLYSAPTSVAASGTSVFTGYIDVPFAVLKNVYDTDGMVPTLANTGVVVTFTTPPSGGLQGTDCLLNPFGTAGTLALSSTAPGTVSVWAHMARQVSVTATGSLPPFIVASAFVLEDVAQAFSQGPAFYPFQGQEANLILVKSIAVIDSPGELAGEYSNPANLTRLDLMYDQMTPVYTSQQENQPFFGASGGLSNWMVDQGKAIGDQPPGVLVYDFGRGTDPKYPNSNAYFNLDQFSKAGLFITYAVAPAAGAQIHFFNQYLIPDFFQALQKVG